MTPVVVAASALLEHNCHSPWELRPLLGRDFVRECGPRTSPVTVTGSAPPEGGRRGRHGRAGGDDIVDQEDASACGVGPGSEPWTNLSRFPSRARLRGAGEPGEQGTHGNLRLLPDCSSEQLGVIEPPRRGDVVEWSAPR